MAEAITIGAAEIKLILDSKEFKDAVHAAVKNSDELEKSVKRTGESVQKAGVALTAAGAVVLGALGYSLKAAAEEEKTFKLLAQAVENTGTSWKSVSKDLDGFIASLQHATKYGDSDTAQMLTTLTILTGNYNLSVRHAEDVMDLATGKQMDLNAAATIYGRVLNGDVELLKRYGIDLEAQTGKKLKDMSATEKTTAAVAALRQMYGGMAREEGATFLGVLDSLFNALGDISELIGGVLMETLTPIIKNFRDWTEGTRDWIAKHKELMAVLVPMVAAFGAFASIVGPLIIALPLIASGLSAIGLGVGLATAGISLIIPLLAGLYVAWTTNFAGIQEYTLATFDYIGDLFKQFFNGLANTIDILRSYGLEAQKVAYDIIGKNTDEIEKRIAIINRNITDREKESAEMSGKTWSDYYNERKRQREEQTKLEKQKIAELELAETDSAIRTGIAKKQDVKELKDMREALWQKTIEKEAEISLKQGEFRTSDRVDFEILMAQKKQALDDYVIATGVSYEEARITMLDTYEKVKLGQADSLNAQEQKALEYVQKVLDDKHFGKLEEETKKKNIRIEFDWNRTLDAMADASANMILDGDMNFKNLGDTITGVFDNLKKTVLGTFQEILHEYVQNFIVNMIKSTTDDLGGGLGGALKNTFSGIFGGGGNKEGGGGILGTVGSIASKAIPFVGIAAGAYGLIKGLGSLFGSKTYKANPEQDNAAHAIIGDMLGLHGMGIDITGSDAAENIKSVWKSSGKEWIYDAFHNVWQGFVDMAYKEGNIERAISVTKGRLQELGYYGKGGGIPNFMTGIDYVPNDMIANIHKGESILAPDLSSFLRRAAVMATNNFGFGNIVVNVNGSVDNPRQFAEMITREIVSNVERRVRFQRF